MQTTPTPVQSDRTGTQKAIRALAHPIASEQNIARSDFLSVFENGAVGLPESQSISPDVKSASPEDEKEPGATLHVDPSIDDQSDDMPPNVGFNAEQTDDHPPAASGTAPKSAVDHLDHVAHSGSIRSAAQHQTVAAAMVNGVAHQDGVGSFLNNFAPLQMNQALVQKSDTPTHIAQSMNAENSVKTAFVDQTSSVASSIDSTQRAGQTSGGIAQVTTWQFGLGTDKADLSSLPTPKMLLGPTVSQAEIARTASDSRQLLLNKAHTQHTATSENAKQTAPDIGKIESGAVIASTPRAIPTHVPMVIDTKLEMSSLLSSDAIEEFVWDLRPQGTAAGSPTQIAVQRQELSNQMAQQLALALHKNPNRPVEIALNPVELGRVRMTFTTNDTGIVVNILADRPETLDLMRRYITDLGDSFSELGYEDIAFAFGQNGAPPDTSSDAQPRTPDTLTLTVDDLEDATAALSDTPSLAILAEGIDLRL